MGHNIILKNQYGEPTTYYGVESIKLPNEDGNLVQFVAPSGLYGVQEVTVVESASIIPNFADGNYTQSMVNDVQTYYHPPLSVTIPKSSNLVPANILEGVSIYGVTGTATTSGETVGKLGTPTLSAPTLNSTYTDSLITITGHPDDADVDVSYRVYYRGAVIGTLTGDSIQYLTDILPMLQPLWAAYPDEQTFFSMLPAVLEIKAHAQGYTDSDGASLVAGMFIVNENFAVGGLLVRTDGGLLAVANDNSWMSTTGLIYQLSDLGLDVTTATDAEKQTWVDTIHVYVVQMTGTLKRIDTSLASKPDYNLVDECIDYTIDLDAGTMTIAPDKVEDMVGLWVTNQRWKELSEELN